VAELGVEGELVTLAYRRGANSEFFSERVAVQTGDLLEKLEGYPKATGFVCYEESTALAVYAACSSLGLRVPDDVSVIGFDDIYAQAAWPPMTVVSHMLEALGRRSAELAVAMLEPDAGGGREVGAGYCETVRAELVLRQSTAPPPDQA
jgi:DNA-binding LacI/PurR family transcriptional regulator